jgi:hypothetical protein
MQITMHQLTHPPEDDHMVVVNMLLSYKLINPSVQSTVVTF